MTTSPAKMRREVRHDVGTLGEVGPNVAKASFGGSLSYEHRPNRGNKVKFAVDTYRSSTLRYAHHFSNYGLLCNSMRNKLEALSFSAAARRRAYSPVHPLERIVIYLIVGQSQPGRQRLDFPPSTWCSLGHPTGRKAPRSSQALTRMVAEKQPPPKGVISGQSCPMRVHSLYGT